MAAGVGLAAVAMFPPSFLSELPGWSRQVGGWIGLGLFGVSLLALIKPDWFWRSKAAHSSQKPEINLIIGRDGHYVETSSFNSVNVMKTVCVGVKNIGATHLSNCKLMFDATRADNGIRETWLRDGLSRMAIRQTMRGWLTTRGSIPTRAVVRIADSRTIVAFRFAFMTSCICPADPA